MPRATALFVHGGLLMAPGGFSQDGVLVKVLLSGGRYRYNAGSLGGEQVIGAEWLAQVLPGFRLKRGDLEAKFFVGPEMQEHRLWPNDPDNRLRGRAFGLRMATELWYQPTPQFMAAADASLASNGTGFTSRAAVGWRIFRLVLFGPEAQIYGADGYRQTRLGTHLTGIQIGPVRNVGGRRLGARFRPPLRPLSAARRHDEAVMN